MLVRMLACFLFVMLGDVVDAYKPSGISQNQGSSVKTSSPASRSSCLSSSYSSSTVPGDWHRVICDRNSTSKKCPNPCPGTCGNPNGVPNCRRQCKKYGCECKPGYVTLQNGKCIKLDDCPDYLRCNDCNAIFKDCPCPRTCDFPGRDGPCNLLCKKNGCQCKDGFYLNDKKKCVQLQDCPGAKTCSVNETFVYCNVGCPSNNCPTDDSQAFIACSPPYPCGSGCSCKSDYLRSKDDNRCILYSDCPPIKCTRPNEVYSSRPPPCLFDKCTDIGKPNQCDRNYPSLPQCICMPGFYRNNDGICVPKKYCTKPTPVCGLNEIYVDCKTACPPQYCWIHYTDYTCVNTSTCIPGCDCLPNYLRNGSDVCIPNNECPLDPPICGCNEVLSYCKIICPPQTCDSIFTSYLCSDEKVCRIGCNCLDEYLRNESGICVPSEECFSAPECDIPLECRQTCANPESNCSTLVHLPTNRLQNQDGCQCQPGYILSDPNGVCIRIEECPDTGCNGDPNAIITQCPWSCPSTCNSPNAGSYGNSCNKVGCQCKPGFILSDDTGKCVLPNECECGNPCGGNETFSECAFRCPNQYCPKDDSQVKVACKPGRPCPSGCLCEPYYLRKSYSDDTCILASDCSAVKCTRPFEVWNSCASECLAEKCDDLITKPECYPDPKNCQPQCVCSKGYYRDTSGICVPKEDCPKVCEVKQECRPTCAVPNPPNCPFIQPAETNDDSCNCQSGYVLSEYGGKCIKVEECPGGNPCGANETFSECAFRCPNQYCPKDDSQVKVACKPGRPCPSGCLCEPYYLRKSYNDDTCILASDCSAVKCTRPFEVWNSCASECLAEKCDDLITKPECYPDPKNCQPQCVCSKGYYRDTSGICVPKEDCPKVCEVKQECRPTCAVPNPPNCPFIQPAETNDDSCNCQSGYVLSEYGGKCIKVEECPANQTCNTDPNAIIKICPLPCPSTCESPNATPCKRKCDPIGCECKPGYLKSKTGNCILPNECEGGNPCGPNATFSSCRFECPTNYCPIDESRAIVICETYPFAPCYSGCQCRLNYRRKSREDPRCILSSECHPLKCKTRPNEEWNSCPSACDSEYCEAVDKKPSVCNTLVFNCDPRCVCIETYYRNSSDICVSSNECRRLNQQNSNN